MHRTRTTVALALSLILPATLQAGTDLLIIEDDSSEEMLIIDDGDTALTSDSTDSTDTLIIGDDGQPSAPAAAAEAPPQPQLSTRPALKVNNLWAELSNFHDDNSAAEQQTYVHGSASLTWAPRPHLELKISGRLDSYAGMGGTDWERSTLDYDESYVRVKTAQSIITLGAQTVIWGRIDEFPPTDRLSTQDLRRFISDDLADRRLASPALRYEHFFDTGKIDVIAYPRFREAQLAPAESQWYPIDQRQGTIMGLDTSPLIESVIRHAVIDEHAPDGDGGFGMRYSSIGSGMDIGVTLQKGRPTTPYFSYNPGRNTLEAHYPRSGIIGTDLGFEALGGTLKLETSWMSATPATLTSGRYTEVESISWGAALELYPGDADTRLNLQLSGQSLIGAPAVLDRDQMYAFNGSYEVPFAANNWRAKTRFNIGLDTNDIYLNPELAYTGWRDQELYIDLHYFEGDKGTVGGFHQDHSMIATGWRGNF